MFEKSRKADAAWEKLVTSIPDEEASLHYINKL
jgi:hypothetical protein